MQSLIVLQRRQKRLQQGHIGKFILASEDPHAAPFPKGGIEKIGIGHKHSAPFTNAAIGQKAFGQYGAAAFGAGRFE